MIKINEDERRDFFRIEDDVQLEINKVSEEEFNAAPETLANLQNDSFSISADFATLNNSVQPILNNIKQSHPDIATFLEVINDKIDSLSQLMRNKDGSKKTADVIKANISASGIQFFTVKPFDIDSLVKLELVLLPEKVGILIFGRVVSSVDNKISIIFEHLRIEDQELMIKHNLNRQMSDIREKNNNN